jgi:serine/threonine-protein kinase HipA
MSVNGKFTDITRQDLLVEADRFGVSRPRQALDAVRAVVEKWREFAQQVGLSDSATERVAADFRVI